MKKKAEDRKKFLPALLCLYAATVAVRFILALATSSYPTIGIDEQLYASLGRSIATEGTLLFRGQAADYSFILYPLVLSPVYLLFGEGTHFYRLIQLWNILLMSTSVFPLFFLGRKLLGSEKKALTAAGLAMLIPDFVLGEFVFSEAILFPLFFVLMYFAYSFLEDDNRRWLLWIGLTGGLLFSTKPGMAAPAAAFMLFVFGRSIVRKNGKDAAWAAGGLAVFLMTTAFFWMLTKFAFGYQGSLMSVYEIQLNGTQEWDAGVFLTALAIYPSYYILSCGITGVLCPAVFRKKWKKEKQVFWWFTAASLAILMIGSAWSLEQVDDVNNVQIRYVAMYMPLTMLFCFLQEEKMENRKKQEQKAAGIIEAAVVPGYVALCTLIFGCKGNAHATNTYPQIALSLLNDRILPLSAQIWGNIIILLLCAAAFFLYVKYRGKKNFSTVCILVMAGTMVINGAFGYSFIHEHFSPEREEDGIAVHQLTEGKPYIYLLSNERSVDYGVDINTGHNNTVVYMNNFISFLQDNNGIYVPYIPEKMRGMAAVSKTPDVDTLVIDYDSYPFLHWSQNVSVQYALNRGAVQVVHFTPGERIVDSTISNIRKRILNEGIPGILMLYNEEYMQKPFTLRMEIRSETEQEMTVNSTHEIYAVHIAPGTAWYEVAFEHAEEAFNIKITDAPVEISAYELVFE